MLLHVVRFDTKPKHTIGAMVIDGEFECFTYEDTFRYVKVPAQTRIPEGLYQIGLRTYGTKHEQYSRDFADIHKGMLEILDVVNFTDVLIHIGNRAKDTEGCLLIGDTAVPKDSFVGQSLQAYVALYQKVIAAFDRNEKVMLRISSMF